MRAHTAIVELQLCIFFLSNALVCLLPLSARFVTSVPLQEVFGLVTCVLSTIKMKIFLLPVALMGVLLPTRSVPLLFPMFIDSIEMK